MYDFEANGKFDNVTKRTDKMDAINFVTTVVTEFVKRGYSVESIEFTKEDDTEGILITSSKDKHGNNLCSFIKIPEFYGAYIVSVFDDFDDFDD